MLLHLYLAKNVRESKIKKRDDMRYIGKYSSHGSRVLVVEVAENYEIPVDLKHSIDCYVKYLSLFIVVNCQVSRKDIVSKVKRVVNRFSVDYKLDTSYGNYSNSFNLYLSVSTKSEIDFSKAMLLPKELEKIECVSRVYLRLK